jgi:hypothetical protein
MPSKAEQQAAREQAIEELRAALPKGSTVYLVLRHVSASGMTRWIDPIVFVGEPNVPGPRWYGWRVAEALGWKYDREHNGVKVGGAGMDMGFHLVYELARVLYGDGYELTHRWL